MNTMRICILMCMFIIHLNSNATEKLDKAFDVAKQSVVDGEVPGAIVQIFQNGELVRQEAFGFCDIENQKPMQTDTICWLASITKPITVAATMKLVEDGKLSLDDTVETFLPEFKDQIAEDGKHYSITIRQLMSHSSGIQPSPPSRPRDFFAQSWFGREIREIAPLIAKTKLKFKPGTNLLYSNAAPYVLARILELKTGKPFHQHVQEAVLDPLGMNETYFILPKPKADRYALVYRRSRGTEDVFFRFNSNWDINMTMPDGGLFAPPIDVAKFVQMFLDNDGSVLSQSSVQAMLTEQITGWGLGWEIDNDRLFKHTGSAGTLAWGDPKTGIVGILFFQIQDFDLIPKLREKYMAAVNEAFSD